MHTTTAHYKCNLQLYTTNVCLQLYSTTVLYSWILQLYTTTVCYRCTLQLYIEAVCYNCTLHTTGIHCTFQLYTRAAHCCYRLQLNAAELINISHYSYTISGVEVYLTMFCNYSRDLSETHGHCAIQRVVYGCSRSAGRVRHPGNPGGNCTLSE